MSLPKFQATCPECEREYDPRPIRSWAESDADVHNGLIHPETEPATVEEVG